MHLNRMMRICSLIAAIILTGSAAAQQPAIDPRCFNIMKAMAAHLEAVPYFTFSVKTSSEKVIGAAGTVDISKRMDAFVRRTRYLKMEVSGAGPEKSLWFDGRKLTLLDAGENLYARATVPGRISTALDYAMDRLGFTMPLIDFVMEDLYENFTTGVESGTYMGTAEAAGYQCHHLAFTQSDIDWEIWIEEGDEPFPRKIMIMYKTIPNAPRFEAAFTRWELYADIPDDKFVFTPPEGAEMIEFLTADAE